MRTDSDIEALVVDAAVWDEDHEDTPELNRQTSRMSDSTEMLQQMFCSYGCVSWINRGDV